jgi:aromatic-amino-acid transaminase
LKVGADLLKRFAPAARVLISDPSWENHRALFESAGFEVQNYRYYDAASHGLAIDGLLADLAGADPGSVVVLHACCHNPTGVDPTPAQWGHIVAACAARRLIPFLDIAYQGFADGIKEDALAVDKFVASGMVCLVATSFSKSFSLYGERVGALSVVCRDRDEAARVLSQLKRVVRTNYSNPPTHGAAVVAAVLNSPELRAQWEQELAGMRERIRAIRTQFIARLTALGVQQDFSFVARQRGMFSYSGLTAAQVDRLRSEFGIYAVSTGRICVAALNERNLDAVVGAIAKVL